MSKIIFRLYDLLEINHLIESHISIQQLRELRIKGGPHRLYCDYMVPSHYTRFSPDNDESQMIGFEVVKELDMDDVNHANRINERLQA